MWRVGLEGKIMEKLKVYVNGSKKERKSGGKGERDSKAQHLPEKKTATGELAKEND